MNFDHSNVLLSGNGVLFTKFGCHRALPEQYNSWLTLADTCMTFNPSIALHFSQRFFLPNLVVIGLSWAIIDPWLTSVYPCMTFDPNNVLYFGQGFFPLNMVTIEQLLQNFTSGWPLTFCRVASKLTYVLRSNRGGSDMTHQNFEFLSHQFKSFVICVIKSQSFWQCIP